MHQNDMILEHLKAGNGITPIEALNKFGCFRLSGRIFDLKAKGHNIEKRMMTNGHKTYAQYYMPDHCYKVEPTGQPCI